MNELGHEIYVLVILSEIAGGIAASYTQLHIQGARSGHKKGQTRASAPYIFRSGQDNLSQGKARYFEYTK